MMKNLELNNFQIVVAVIGLGRYAPTLAQHPHPPWGISITTGHRPALPGSGSKSDGEWGRDCMRL